MIVTWYAKEDKDVMIVSNPTTYKIVNIEGLPPTWMYTDARLAAGRLLSSGWELKGKCNG